MLLFFCYTIQLITMMISSFVPNFRILTQAVAEKYLTEKNVHVYYIRVKEGKNEKLKKKQNEDLHLNFHLHSTLCLSEGVYQILKQWLQ